MGYEPVPYRPSRRLGTTALVLGIVAIVTLVLCGLGLLVAIAGLVVGIVAAAQNKGRGMAVGGIALSVLTMVIAAGAITWFSGRVQPCTKKRDYPTTQERNDCIQRRVPFIKSSPRP